MIINQMQSNNFANWGQIESILIGAGVERRYKIPGSNYLTLLSRGNSSLFGVEVNSSISDSLFKRINKLQNISITTYNNNNSYYEIWTNDKTLFSEFYTFVIDVAILMDRDNIPCDSAIDQALSNLEGLIASKPSLSDKNILGLIGELYFLKRLISINMGLTPNGWIGPINEPHDFRYGDLEFEVKSTLKTKRIHIINGLNQPYPSIDCKLFFISLQFMEASGTDLITLPGLVSEIRNILSNENLLDFNMKLQTFGYRSDHEVFYSRLSLKLRSLPKMIPVNDDFPRIPNDIDNIYAPLQDRLGDVIYKIDLESYGKDLEDSILLELF